MIDIHCLITTEQNNISNVRNVIFEMPEEHEDPTLIQNRMKCIYETSEPYVSWVDPDDEWNQNGFKLLINELENDKNLVACYSMRGWIIDNKKIDDEIHEWSRERMLSYGPLFLGLNQMIVIRKSVLDSFTDNEKETILMYPYISETLLYATLASKGNFKAYPKNLYWRTIRENSATPKIIHGWELLPEKEKRKIRKLQIDLIKNKM